MSKRIFNQFFQNIPNNGQNTLYFLLCFYYYLFSALFLLVPSVVYDNSAFGFFRPSTKMLRFWSTNRSSKKKAKNTIHTLT